MMADLKADEKQAFTNRLIKIIAMLGAVALGVGVLMWVAANWQAMTALTKSLLLVSGTLLMLGVSYYLQFEKKEFKRIGQALNLLAAVLFCASVFLIAQIYHINANAHWLILVCLAGVSPLAYATRSFSLTLISALGFYGWLAMVGFRAANESLLDERLFVMVPLLLIHGTMLVYYFGAYHSLVPEYLQISRWLRLISLHVLLLVLIALTFGIVTGPVHGIRLDDYNQALASQLATVVIGTGLLAIGVSVSTQFFHTVPSSIKAVEIPLVVILVITNLLFVIVPPSTYAFTAIYTLLYIGLLLGALVTGFRKRDHILINLGVLYSGIFMIVRYIDWFWDLLQGSAFFMVGGLVLLAGGVILEMQRRRLIGMTVYKPKEEVKS